MSATSLGPVCDQDSVTEFGLTVRKQGSVFSAVCNFFILFVFVTQISREPLDGFAPNSQRRRAWLVPRWDEFEYKGKSSKVKVTSSG